MSESVKNGHNEKRAETKKKREVAKAEAALLFRYVSHSLAQLREQTRDEQGQRQSRDHYYFG